MMHKNFYASGFLFHLPSQQILLQQPQSSSQVTSQWNLFNTSYKEGEDAQDVFKKLILDLLQIKIDPVYSVYSYANDSTDTQQTILYSELQELHDFPPRDGLVFNWFSFKDVTKLPLPEQIKHDIVVGQRVIDAARRKSEGLHTF